MGSLGITVFGVIALTFMMVMYALERRHSSFVVAFALLPPPRATSAMNVIEKGVR